MDTTEEDFTDVSFDFSLIEFKKCAQACFDSKKDNLLVTLSDEGIHGSFDDFNVKKSKRRKGKQDKLLKQDEPESGKTSPVVSDDIEKLHSVNKDVDQEQARSQPKVTRSRRRRKSPEVVPAELDTVPLSQRLRRSTRRNRRQSPIVLLNTEPIEIDDDDDDDYRPPPSVLDSIEIQDSEEEDIPIPDEKLDEKLQVGIHSSIDDDADIDNCEVRVKVWWRFLKMHFFSIRKYQKLTTVFEHFSKLEDVPLENIWLTVRDVVKIKPTDTPDSLKLGVADIIEGGVTKQKTEYTTSLVPEPAVEDDSLEFKLLIKDRKKPLLLRIRSDQQMKLLMIKCSEELEVSLDKLKFSFDGETLDSSSTPMDLDLEGGECIEVIINK